jgi:ribosome maturation protein Sdo1
MKVKIKKEGKTKQYNVISKWSDVTLENWLKLVDPLPL